MDNVKVRVKIVSESYAGKVGGTEQVKGNYG